MFLGQYRHNLDIKGRLTVPSKYRELLVDGAYLTQGFDRNLRLLTTMEFEAISRQMRKLSITDQNTRQLQRLIFASAVLVQIDRVGRILIPQFLRDYAGLNSDAVIVGVGDAVEIWSPKSWDNQLLSLNDADANAERFSAVDLTVDWDPTNID